MKFYFIVSSFVFVYGLAVATLTAQMTPPRTIEYALPVEPNATELQKQDLKWINSSNSFDQSNLDSAAIDREIEKRIKAYDRETAIVTFDVPINSKRLTKPKFQHYVEFNPQINELWAAKNGNALDKKAYFWRYGDIDIAVPDDTYKDQLNVYAVARAIEILKYRYPKAYNKLFVEIRNFSSDSVNFGICKNRFPVLLFSFDESPLLVASGATAWAGDARYKCDGDYSNVSVVSIDNINIQGISDSGSKPIYNALTSEENYIRYLREGLVETMVHEMLHRYIDYRRSHEQSFNALFDARSKIPGSVVCTGLPSNIQCSGFANSLYSPFSNLTISGEEAIIITTSLHYFAREGGIQSNLLFYYRGTLDTNITTLNNSSLVKGYAELIDPSGNVNTLYKDRLRLKILD